MGDTEGGKKKRTERGLIRSDSLMCYREDVVSHPAGSVFLRKYIAEACSSTVFALRNPKGRREMEEFNLNMAQWYN